MYGKGNKIRQAADLVSDSMEELRKIMHALPFAEDDEESKDEAVQSRQEPDGKTKKIPEPLQLVATTEFRGK